MWPIMVADTYPPPPSRKAKKRDTRFDVHKTITPDGLSVVSAQPMSLTELTMKLARDTSMIDLTNFDGMHVEMIPSVRAEMDEHARQAFVDARLRVEVTAPSYAVSTPASTHPRYPLRERILDIDAVCWLLAWLRAMRRELFGSSHERRYL